MRTALLFGLIAGYCATAAPGKDKDPPKPDPLVGEWEIVSSTTKGKTSPFDLGPRKFTFTAEGKYSDDAAGRGEKARWQTYKADGKAEPSTLDIIDPTRTLRWLYRVDGDTLTICLPEDATAARPTAIEAGKGSKNLLLTLKRVTPKK
jgi:uncharacterized protein (TIGR03067 family)